MAGGDVGGNTQQVEEHSLSYVKDFQRFEFKYWIPKRWVNVLVSDLYRLMDLDPYSAGGVYYPLYSVYYDTEDWQAYYEKMDGVERRKKFRVRSYAPNPGADDMVNLEIKEKNKDIILKRRMRVPVSEVDAVARGQYGGDDPVGAEWRFSQTRDALRPKVLVAYKRLAFVPKGPGDYRITVDADVSWGRPSSSTDFGASTRPVPMLRDASVLEIKFAKYPPRFIFDLIQRYNLRNDAISKYCESVIAMHRMIL